MGGSSGGLGLSLGQIAELEQKAKDVLREGAEPERCNVFTSFASEDLADVNLLRGQAKNENLALEFNDWSLREPFDSDNAEYVRRGIRERIRMCSVTMVFVSEHTADSRWVNWEIDESVRLGKRVIALYAGDRPPSRLPPALVRLGVQPVPWNHQAIMAAIAEATKKK